MTTHSFDIDADPAQIVWGKRELTVDERKSGLIGQAKSEFQQVVNAEVAKQMDDDPASVYDPDVVATAQATLNTKLTAIDGATTHEDLDAL